MAIAELTSSVIVNADAMQVYADLRIVTARPSLKEESRQPHALFGHLDGAEVCSAAIWAAQARSAIAAARRDDRLPILVGGSGLYVKTLLDGIAPIPIIDPEVRRAVRAMPVAEAYAALAQADGQAAERLAPADTTRVARALEVALSTGHPISYWQQHMTGGIAGDVATNAVVLAPDRAALNARIDARFDTIMDEGQAEVAALIERRLDPRLPVMRAIGVREIAAMLGGTATHDATRMAGRLASQRYAKRQATWFARQCPPEWQRAPCSITAENAQELAIKLVFDALTA